MLHDCETKPNCKTVKAIEWRVVTSKQEVWTSEVFEIPRQNRSVAESELTWIHVFIIIILYSW